ncbi:FkbM family methyltransferase [Methylobacterium sp. WSM2598]|uniref:FkbM family methyltransferase n=1 Tax=Methylobacterium sp. WSM2598 TaxID=398261 RepID=UPI000A00A50D|nr:FkbM family methyltransferase [Methylobacterium sp. WSM2598]
MKAQILQLFSWFVRKLPERRKIQIVKTLADDQEFARLHARYAIAAFAGPAGVTGVASRGVSGTIVSQPYDFSVHRAYSEKGDWAKTTVDKLKEFFDKNGGVGYYLDIGANIGLTTIPIAQSYPNVHCFAFEPEPHNFMNLEINTKINCRHANYKLFRLALFKENSNLQFEIAPENLGDHRIRIGGNFIGDIGEHLRPVINVEAVPLNDFAAHIKTPLAVKIDVQGAEPFVFEGGKDVLKKAGIIILEWWPYTMKRMKADPDIIFEFIKSNFASCSIAAAEGTGESRSYAAQDAINILKSNYDKEAESEKIYYDLTMTTPVDKNHILR